MSQFQTHNNINMMGEYSIYIPRVRREWNWSSMASYMESLGIGKVTRVDFTPVKTATTDPTKKEFYFIENSQAFSAFVHFSKLYNNKLTSSILTEIDMFGQYKHTIKMNNGERDETWFMKECHNPVGYPIYNMAQICELIRGLEEKVDIQQKKITELELKVLENNNESVTTDESMPGLISTTSSTDTEIWSPNNKENARVTVSANICGNF